jgi:eukaryotic-like serine/threonine-protein kinase
VRTADDATSTGDGPIEAPSTPRVGDFIDGRYRVTRLIGAGGMGTVFEAQHLSLGRRYALKFLRAELAGSARNVSRLEREARLLGQLEHEHLAAMLDYGLYQRRSPYLVMEYLEGRTLKDMLKEQGPLSIACAIEIMLQVGRGMAHVHGQGIVHRDLKPANLIWLTRSDGRPWIKILDFGIARTLQEVGGQLTPSGAELGTAHYMSPEQARGARDVDPRSDIYSLGAVMYEALTGRHLYPGDSYNEVIFQLLTQSHRPLADALPACPTALRAIVERCLDKDAHRRYADANQFVADLSALASTHATSLGSAVQISSGPRTIARGPLLRQASWLGAGVLLGSLASASLGIPPTEPRQMSASALQEGRAPGDGGAERKLSSPWRPPPSETQVAGLRPGAAEARHEASGSALAARPTTLPVSQQEVRVEMRGLGSDGSTSATGRATVVHRTSPNDPARPRPDVHQPVNVTDSSMAKDTTEGALPAAEVDPDGSFPFVTSNPYGP